MPHAGLDVASIVDISDGFMFNARKVLHAGVVRDDVSARSRLVLIAFTVLSVGTLHARVRDDLRQLQFPLPSSTQVCQATHGSVPGDPVRLRQLSVREAFLLPRCIAEQHEVIEVLDD